jgi:hypothetical protein
MEHTDMKRYKLARLAAGALGALLLVPGLATAQTVVEEQPTMLSMTGDLLIARPIGLVATVAGSAVFLVTLPFSAAGGNVAEAGEVLVAGPARTTFVRCLGCRLPGRKQQMDSGR